MAQNKEQLGKLLDFIDSLCKEEGNEWFVQELQHRFGIKVTSESVTTREETFASAVRLQKMNNKKRAYRYFADVPDTKLRNQLIAEHAKMLWYKATYNYGQYFNHVQRQLENLLNFYLTATNYQQVLKDNPKIYKRIISFPNSNYTMDIDVYKDAYIQPGKLKNLSKLSIWSKFVYWANDSNVNNEFFEKNISNISNINKARNSTSHANSNAKDDSLSYWQSLKYDLPLCYIEALIGFVKDTVVNL